MNKLLLTLLIGLASLSASSSQPPVQQDTIPVSMIVLDTASSYVRQAYHKGEVWSLMTTMKGYCVGKHYLTESKVKLHPAVIVWMAVRREER